MFRHSSNIDGQTGIGLLAVFLILATLSFSVLGLALQKITKMSELIEHQRRNQDIRMSVKNVLKDALVDLFATGSIVDKNHTYTDYKVAVLNYETQANIADKPVKLTTLSVSGIDTLSHAPVYSERVTVKRQKRLLRPPLKDISHRERDQIELLAQAYFSLSQADLMGLSKHANRVQQNCKKLTTNQSGLIWITGRCHLDRKTLGSERRPIMLVIENAELKIDHSQIFGLVFHLCTHLPSLIPDIGITSKIDGAFLSTCGMPGSSVGISYNAGILNTLIEHDDNIETTVIEGSWWRG